MQAVILCGGQGTRLSALYPDTPKGLVPVAGKPFLQWQLEWLRNGGVKRVHLAAGYLADRIRDWAERSAPAGMTVTVSAEPEPLGTGGGLKYVERFIDDRRILVLNGDSLLPNLIFQSLPARPRLRSKGAGGVKSPENFPMIGKSPTQEPRTKNEEQRTRNQELIIAVTRIESAGRYGTVEFGEDQRITAFLEKAQREAGWINAGVYALDRILLEEIPAGKKLSLETDLFPEWTRQGRLRAAPFDPPLLDMGTPDGLAAMEAYLRSDRSDS